MNKHQRSQTLLQLAVIPTLLLVTIAVELIHRLTGFFPLSTYVLLAAVAIGSFKLIKDTARSLWQREFALDYIALAAITTGIVAGDYLVAAVICLMLAGGNALEEYAKQRAEWSLKALANRIPDQVHLWTNGAIGDWVPIKNVAIGQEIVVRKGEVIPLDGSLVTTAAAVDESSLTGEPYPVEKEPGDALRSGTVNAGELMVMKVEKTEADSSYRTIVALVTEARRSKSPLVRLADRYSTFFTLFTFSLAATAYFLTGDPERVLAVLVLATPCPLILATPIALIGGMSAAARRGIIVKNLASLESLSRTQDLILDKTGTITLGQLHVEDVTSLTKAHTDQEILKLAASIERSSLHPIAKAIVAHANHQKMHLYRVSQVTEKIGDGISALIGDHRYALNSSLTKTGIAVKLLQDRRVIGTILLHDQIKKDSHQTLMSLSNLGLKLHLLSGDTQARVTEMVASLKVPLMAQAECEPTDKLAYIKKLQKAGRVTAMVGDGINDAPALAAADTGIVFSNEEQSASSNAADIVLLGNHFTHVQSIISIAQATIRIALESIWVGLGLSIVGMILASFGYVPPLVGALSQEVIDVFVILNALRASRLKGC